MEEYVVYILASDKTFKLYKGYTSNLIERMKSHNEFGKGWTRAYRPWRVIHIEFYTSKREAKQREKWFKSGVGRDWINKNIV